MALAIDASSPAVANNTTANVSTVTSASFTPPARSILLISWSGNSHPATDTTTPGIADNLSVPLTYSLQDWSHRGDGPAADGQAAMWIAKVTTSAAMTITVTNNTTGSTATDQQSHLKIWVLAGADFASPVGAHGKSGSTNASTISQSYVAQRAAGWGFLVVCDWDDNGAFTIGSGCTSDGSAPSGNIAYEFARRSIADDVSGSSNTLNTSPALTSTNIRWAWAEILPDLSAVPTVIPPPLLWTLIASLQANRGEAAATTPTSAEGGTSPLGLAGISTLSHIGTAGGTAALGLAATGTAAKVVAQGGTCALGLAGSAAAVKKSPQAGIAALGLASAATDKKVAVEGGICALGLAGASIDRKVAVERGISALGLAATGTAAKKAPQAGLSPAGLYGYHSGLVPRQIAGVGYLGLAGTATERKVAVQAGTAAVGLASSGTAAKKAPARGASFLGLAVTHFKSAAREVAGRLFFGLWAYDHNCSIHRPVGGTVPRPNTGTVAYGGSTVTRPNTGVVARPNTGIVEPEC